MLLQVGEGAYPGNDIVLTLEDENSFEIQGASISTSLNIEGHWVFRDISGKKEHKACDVIDCTIGTSYVACR